jgi:phage/plasmid-like protein (TIGR03299 family)
MAHHLEEKDTMFSGSNTVPWHGLGTVIEGRADSQRALTLARLDWEVENRPIYTADMQEIPKHRALTRTDDGSVLGIVGAKYGAFQNRSLAEIAESIVSTGEACFETAGSLFSGQIVWFLLKIGERTLCNGEDHKQYVLASNGHAGRARVSFSLVDTRVVCWNTYSAARAEGGAGFSVTHTAKVMDRVETAIKIMRWSHEGTESLFRSYEMLIDKSFTLDQAQRLLSQQIMPKESQENIDQVLELYRNGAGNSGKTAYDLFNGVTDWLDHYETKNQRAAELRMERVTIGREADLKQHTLNTLLAI